VQGKHILFLRQWANCGFGRAGYISQASTIPPRRLRSQSTHRCRRRREPQPHIAQRSRPYPTAWRGIYRKPANGAGGEELRVRSQNLAVPKSWSPDGRFIVYAQINPGTGADLNAIPADGDRKLQWRIVTGIAPAAQRRKSVLHFAGLANDVGGGRHPDRFPIGHSACPVPDANCGYRNSHQSDELGPGLAPDGNRFLIITPNSSGASTVTLALN